MSRAKGPPKSGKPAESAEQIREAVTRLAKANQKAQADSKPDKERAEPDPERLSDALRRAEAVLFASDEPIDAKTLTEALPPGIEPGDVLVRLKQEYSKRGVQLVEVGGKWRFQSAPDLAFLFEETREQ